jgi:hypothetical protein
MSWLSRKVVMAATGMSGAMVLLSDLTIFRTWGRALDDDNDHKQAEGHTEALNTLTGVSERQSDEIPCDFSLFALLLIFSLSPAIVPGMNCLFGDRWIVI